MVFAVNDLREFGLSATLDGQKLRPLYRSSVFFLQSPRARLRVVSSFDWGA